MNFFDPDEWQPPADGPERFCCIGADVRGPEHCTCWVPRYERTQAPPDLSTKMTARDEMCKGCAYRPGTDAWTARTEGSLHPDLAAVFRCHTELRRIVAWCHPDGTVIELAATEIDHVGFQAYGTFWNVDGTQTELCSDWADRHPVRADAALRGGTA